MTSRLFADISSNNSEFNAATYRAAGHVLVAIKATEGSFYINPDHRTWTLHAHLEQLGVIHYHFARPDTGSNPEHEAAFFLAAALPNSSARDYLVLDIERATPQGWTHDPSWCQSFDRCVRANSRFRTVLYASRSVLSQSDQWLDGDPRRAWDADYSAGPDYAPAGYDVFARQFTDGINGPAPHELAGVGRCDVNRMGAQLWADVA